MYAIKHILGIATLAALTACGGGGDSSSTPPVTVIAGFDSAEFEGTWTRTDGTDTHCFTFVEYGGNYYGLNKPLVIAASSVTSAVTVYNDAACTSKAGVFKNTASVSWSAAAVPGKTNVAHALVVSTGYSIGPDGDGTGIKFTSPPVSGESTKVFLDVDGPKLFVGDRNSALTTDGYPSALEETALYAR